MHHRGHEWDLREEGQEGKSSNYTLINFFIFRSLLGFFKVRLKYLLLERNLGSLKSKCRAIDFSST